MGRKSEGHHQPHLKQKMLNPQKTSLSLSCRRTEQQSACAHHWKKSLHSSKTWATFKPVSSKSLAQRKNATVIRWMQRAAFSRTSRGWARHKHTASSKT